MTVRGGRAFGDASVIASRQTKSLRFHYTNTKCQIRGAQEASTLHYEKIFIPKTARPCDVPFVCPKS